MKPVGAEVFRLSEPPASSPNRLLGLWSVGDRVDGADVTFSDGAGSEEGEPVWIVELPGDPDAATERLREWGSRLRAIAGELPSMEDRLARMEAAELASLEGALAPAPETVFGPGARARTWWSEASRDLDALLDRVGACLSPASSIETRVEGELVARSLVGLRGSVRTLLDAGAKPERLALHCSAVTLAVSSRATLVRIMALLVTGALGISLRLSLPGGPRLALGATWRSVREVLDGPAGWRRSHA